MAFLLMISLVVQCEKGKASNQKEIQIKKNDSLAVVKKDSLIQDSIKRNTIIYQSFIFPKKRKILPCLFLIKSLPKMSKRLF